MLFIVFLYIFLYLFIFWFLSFFFFFFSVFLCFFASLFPCPCLGFTLFILGFISKKNYHIILGGYYLRLYFLYLLII